MEGSREPGLYRPSWAQRRAPRPGGRGGGGGSLNRYRLSLRSLARTIIIFVLGIYYILRLCVCVQGLIEYLMQNLIIDGAESFVLLFE